MSHYGTIVDATSYFTNRLHEHAWSEASPADRTKALIGATQRIDALNFKGCKNTVYDLLQANSDATEQEIRTAEAAQALEFPRGADTVVPTIIKQATYEIAHDLLDGKIPEIELENLAVTSFGFSTIRAGYQRGQVPQEHLINGIPSSLAWRWLKPFLRDDDSITLSRVS